jgi:Protein of unknown function (DUF3224)
MVKGSIVTALAVLALASAGAATAAGQGTMQVSGIQTPVTAGPCWDVSALASYAMSGDLTGCWYVDQLACRAQPSGTVECSGYEHFVGSIGDRSGTLYFANDFTGKFDLSTYAEIHGRCHHPILSGDGEFTGATGSLNFKDDVTTGCASYTGHITF